MLEIVHAATGMVASNPVLTTFQVFSRVMIVCGVLIATYAARESIGLVLCLVAWGITEIIRYSTYTLNILGGVPYFLKWMRFVFRCSPQFVLHTINVVLSVLFFFRYSLFIMLYPIGITGELLCLYAAQKEVGEGQLYSIQMPNKYNFIFNYQYLLIFFMFLYIPSKYVFLGQYAK